MDCRISWCVQCVLDRGTSVKIEQERTFEKPSNPPFFPFRCRRMATPKSFQHNDSRFFAAECFAPLLHRCRREHPAVPREPAIYCSTCAPDVANHLRPRMLQSVYFPSFHTFDVPHAGHDARGRYFCQKPSSAAPDFRDVVKPVAAAPALHRRRRRNSG